MKKDREELESLKTSVVHKALNTVLLGPDKGAPFSPPISLSSKLPRSCTFPPTQLGGSGHSSSQHQIPHTHSHSPPFTNYLADYQPLASYSIPLPLCHLLRIASFLSSMYKSTHLSLLSLSTHPSIHTLTSPFIYLSMNLTTLPHPLIDPSFYGFIHSL